MLETNSILCPEPTSGVAENPSHHKNGHSGTPTAIHSTPLAQNDIRQLAKTVGDDWKSRPYYDEVESCMEQQWRNAVWPFILDADFSYVVDLAAGHGRNSEKLKQYARHIHIVDINQENIDFCRKRFAGDPKFTFTRNDGYSLSFLPTGSVSLLYCFDAMVHFDSDVVRAYLKEFKRILQPGGLGFCHHSNYTKNPGGDVHDNPGWRNFMSESLFAHYCRKEGLIVVKSRLIDWEQPGSDCITLFRQAGGTTKSVRNGWDAAESTTGKKTAPANRPEIFNCLDSAEPRKAIVPCPIEPAPINRTTSTLESRPAAANSLATVRQFQGDAELPVVPESDAITTSAQRVDPNANARKVRSVVVVLGMPRSGTSLLTSLLQGLGVDLGEKLAAADANNPAGYWEQEEICQTQERLLELLARRWIDETGTMSFPAEWWKLPEVKPFKDRLASIVSAELSRCNGLWGFKDPRTSRMIPLWKEIFAELNIKPIYILALREPGSAVESMVKLYDLPAARTELLWVLHTLDAVRDSGKDLRLILDYDTWFSNPREQAKAIAHALEVEWPADEGPLLSGFNKRIRPDLRHCNSKRQPLLPFSTEIYTVLKSAAALKSIPTELQNLDREVRRAISLCTPWSTFIEKTTRPEPGAYSFVEHFPKARLEQLGPQASSAIWDALIDGPMQKALFLHPPARLHFHVPDGRRARLTFAVNIHPHAWNKPNAGGCEFIVTADKTVCSIVRVDPVNVTSDRRWHECTLEIPENLNGSHDVVFETRPWGNSLDFRWAVWRDPRLTWSPPAPTLPESIFGK